MDYRILGPLEVAREGRALSLGGGKQRALLAMLLLHRNEIVQTDRLIDALWEGQPPATAIKIVQLYVSQLRKALGDDSLVTQARGYVLRVDAGELDAERFERLVAQGRRALADGDPETASLHLREALALRRGSPLADFAYDDFAQAEIARLEELQLAALEERIEADLALGRHADVVGELEDLVAREPLRERLRGQLMLALYRSGRQADALESYREARRTLDHDLGLEPGAALQELERQILRQDVVLAAPRRVPPPEERGLEGLVPAGLRRRGPVFVAVGALVLGAGIATAVLELTRGEPSPPVPQRANALGVIDAAENKLVDAIPLGGRPGPVVTAGPAVWVANLDAKTVVRVDPASRRVVGTIPSVEVADGLASGRNSVWAVSSSSSKPHVTIRRIDSRFDAVAQTINVPATPGGSGSVATAGGALWVAPSLGLVTRLDPSTGRALARVDPRSSPTSLAAGGGAVWLTDDFGDTVTRIDSTGVVTTVPVGRGPRALALGAGALWVAETLDDAVVRIDPDSAAVKTTIPVGRSPVAVAVGAGAVWVANQRDGTVSRIDPATDKVVATIDVGGSPVGLAVRGERVWVSLQPRSPEASSETPSPSILRVNAEDVFDSLDPALAADIASWQVEYPACAKLLNYPDLPPPEGSRLRPEIAEALPAVSADGTTYTFRIRKGFRFSPPSNEPVTARTFKYSIERALDPRLRGPAAAVASDIVGARAYLSGRAKHVAGIKAAGNTLTIRLEERAPDFLSRIALPYFCPVPLGTPIDAESLHAIPSAGPYYISSNTPKIGVVLERNPNYPGGRPRAFRRIEVTLGVGKQRTVDEIEAGTADYALDGVPLREAARLAERYGSGSAEAAAGRQRYFVNPLRLVFFFVLNTSRPLFADVRMRRAFNYAIDRRTLARVGANPLLLHGTPTDQYLPPGMPGFRDAAIYPFRPDVARARSLARGRRTTAVLYTCDVSPCVQQAQVLQKNLRAIGVTLVVKSFPLTVLFDKIGRRGEPYDVARVGWVAEYDDPANFLNVLLDGRLVKANGGANYSFFDDPDYNRRLRAAARLSGPARYLAYEELDADLVRDAAPLAAYATIASHDFFSARIGCQTFHPIYGVDLAALCVRPTGGGAER